MYPLSSISSPRTTLRSHAGYSQRFHLHHRRATIFATENFRQYRVFPRHVVSSPPSIRSSRCHDRRRLQLKCPSSVFVTIFFLYLIFNRSLFRISADCESRAPSVLRYAVVNADLSVLHVGRRRIGHRIRPMSCPKADSHGLRFGPKPERVGKGQTSEHTAVGPGGPSRTSHSW